MAAEDTPRGYASPPCLAAEIAPEYFDPLATDPQQASDVARWRHAERARLRAARRALSAPARTALAKALASGLESALRARFGPLAGHTIALTWPIHDEPDLRPLMQRLHAEGARVALPVVEAPRTPLAFRLWTPATRLQRGHWGIPVPPPDAPRLTPDAVIAPVLGWDPQGFRLGYGGGYFDRTLAALSPRPCAIATGPASARLPTIFPQPHDIPFDLVVTEAGPRQPEPNP